MPVVVLVRLASWVVNHDDWLFSVPRATSIAENLAWSDACFAARRISQSAMCVFRSRIWVFRPLISCAIVPVVGSVAAVVAVTNRFASSVMPAWALAGSAW